MPLLTLDAWLSSRHHGPMAQGPVHRWCRNLSGFDVAGVSQSSSDEDVATGLAMAVGSRLLEVREASVADGVVGAELKARGDRGAQLVVDELLGLWRPNDSVLSEEAVDDLGRLAARRVWIIDPLDGTREFSEPDREDWAVHVALVVDGQLALGVLALPAQGEMLLSWRVNQPPARPEIPRLVVSRTRAPHEAERAAAELGGVLVPMGSAGAKVAAVVRGEADLYVHAGGQFEWDLAAPIAVARAAGLTVCRLDGSAPCFNQRDPSLPDIVIGSMRDVTAVVELLRARD
jgi:3'(2'), 5'-bisphosphate nucleotidase